MSKLDEIKNKAKETASEIADKAKNYDYKAKAEELKEKASDIADKAKNYDYKSKAEEIKENVKNYNYEEKAKEFSEAAKNYDYKGEAEKIKKGGLKYFWNKHRKLSIAFIAIIVIGFFVFPNSDENNIDNTSKTATENVVKKFIKDDDLAVDIAVDLTYKAVGGKNPEFLSSDIIERNKRNGYLIEVIWKEDSSNRYTTNFVVFIGINEKLPNDKWDYKYNYLFSQSPNYLEDLVPKLKSKVEWVD